MDRSSLPPLDSPYPVPGRAVQELREAGHTCLPGLASADEIAAYGPVIVRVARERCGEKRPLAERDSYSRAFLQVINLWLADATVRAFVCARRFARVAAELMGVPRVRLYHDQALLKEPGGGPMPWHQDQFYWPLGTRHTLTLWMPLVDLPPEIGSMSFAAGSQRLGSLGDYAIGDDSERAFAALVAERGLRVESHGPLRAGDATFHTGWTLHRASANPTATLRPVMTVIYFADGARLTGLEHPSRRLDRAAYLPGCEPGETAASPLCPRLWPRPPGAPPEPPHLGRDYWERVLDAAREAGALR